MTKKYTVLLIDDKVENLKYLSNILEKQYDIRASTNSQSAINAAKLLIPDIILLDINMPIIDGFEVCKLLKNEKKLKEIPIIFISAFDDITHKIEAFENGGVDYITKPFEPKEVLARIKTQLDIFNSQRIITNLLKQQDLFIKKIMHEMNTPMSIISLNADSLERKIGPAIEFESIKASVKTLSSIYGDLSYMIKKESRVYEKKNINLFNFISTRIIFFDEIATIKNINIDYEFTHEFDIHVNEYELERIIDNALSNAIKYSKENSNINIFIGLEENKYVLQIKDTGVGIENPDEIFLPYYQQSSNNSGLGLGLTIVKEICDKYDIKISINTKKDVGTTFIYDFTSLVEENEK
ncbi:ATP-binding response regulator [Sulfurospirillum arcachonense]|uniref:ATP-binding response regulator n=1 Tax=Sulfurospirillum arcachonense TaxID=57666 RepID=UPI000468889D|nr:hybrid sensor histidine kinase/response regulator [Sulfurospirillum arcachonense]